MKQTIKDAIDAVPSRRDQQITRRAIQVYEQRLGDPQSAYLNLRIQNGLIGPEERAELRKRRRRELAQLRRSK